MLELRRVTAGYGHFTALWDVTLRVEVGEAVAVVGPNGSGRPTLMRVISGLAAARGGELVFEGDSLAGRKAHEIVRHGIAHVPEGRRIFPRLTVGDNLRMGAFQPRARLERPHPEVVAHGEAREDTAALGDVGDAVADDLVRLPSSQRVALEHELAPARGGEPRDHAHERGPAASVRAHHGDGLARLHPEGDVPERGEVAGASGHPPELEHAHASTSFSPRYASTTRGSSATSSGVPSAIFSP